MKDFFPSANYYADGRQALIDLYRSQGWKRLWVPEYFCYDVIASLEKAGLELMFYDDYPGNREDSKTLEDFQREGYFQPSDAVLRVNYFGMRSFRGAEHLIIPVVEDHTHDLIGSWARNSHADWCIASLRKSLPIPEGGILWSPIGRSLPKTPEASDENERIATIRWEAMRLKTRYLSGENVDKDSFRAGFLNTEEYYDRADICALDRQSIDYLKSFDVLDWYNKKRNNWSFLQDIKNNGVRVILPENQGCYPFSLVLIFDSTNERDRVRSILIANRVYPAILWNLNNCPENAAIFLFSREMLSIHCDGRYTADDIHRLKSIIESV